MVAEVHNHELLGSNYWIIDDLFKEPNKLARYLFARQTASLQGAPWQDNNKTFFKGRHFDFADKACPVVWLAQNLCKQTIDFRGGFKTNVEGWLDDEDDNDYKNNYWFPHIDNGYTCIIYLNDNDDVDNGTNLYDPSLKDEEWFKNLMKKVPRGTDPWIPKDKIKLLKHIPPQYNRMLLFDGNYFPHGSAVNNKQYFSDLKGSPRDFRSNVSFFFYPYGTKKTKKNL